MRGWKNPKHSSPKPSPERLSGLGSVPSARVACDAGDAGRGRFCRSIVDGRRGFTLVEMLVSVALVVLLMSMFAEIFQLATGAMSTQRGLAENDQRTRSLAAVIRADLDKRTFRNVVPFFPGEEADTSPTRFNNRRGYFYISENDPNDDTDDVLQFTVDAAITTKNRDDTPYYGRATLLVPEDPNNPGNPLPNADLLRDFNQPEADDGRTQPDGASLSPAAEISYFLRNGNLYRRVLLIRKPLPLAGANPQPTDGAGNDLFGNSQYYFVDRDNDPATPAVRSRAFWLDFDFSAHYAGRAIFHGTEDLDNSGAGGAFPLANPAYRFGHNHADGQPREYVSNGFIGRFTQQETSFCEDLDGDGQLDPGEDLNGNGVLDDAFGYPHWIRLVAPDTPANPMDA
ncbi:MAG TPA: prepilin-type N-terminal cleavage/methylation domain-containing protein, partial [Planctomycetaceae bacterium]|nr:prepilin-type N-terminal cleavage/methylation domain-containing protein [Planctomycetaceae bacterium]